MIGDETEYWLTKVKTTLEQEIQRKIKELSKLQSRQRRITNTINDWATAIETVTILQHQSSPFVQDNSLTSSASSSASKSLNKTEPIVLTEIRPFQHCPYQSQSVIAESSPTTWSPDVPPSRLKKALSCPIETNQILVSSPQEQQSQQSEDEHSVYLEDQKAWQSIPNEKKNDHAYFTTPSFSESGAAALFEPSRCAVDNDFVPNGQAQIVTAQPSYRSSQEYYCTNSISDNCVKQSPKQQQSDFLSPNHSQSDSGPSCLCLPFHRWLVRRQLKRKDTNTCRAVASALLMLLTAFLATLVWL